MLRNKDTAQHVSRHTTWRKYWRNLPAALGATTPRPAGPRHGADAVRHEPTPRQASLGTTIGAKIADAARSQIGTRYCYGGDTPAEGFDCSGLVQWAFAQNGVRAPRTVSDQYHAGRAVRVRELGPGDLLFFNTSFKRTTLHVGIATSPDHFVHSPSSGGRVREDRLSDPYWTSVFATARRLVP